MTAARVVKHYILFLFFSGLPMAILFPYYTVFLKQNGLDNTDIGLVNGVFMISVTLTEIPTGIIADLWGRKQSLLIGLVLFVVGCGVYGSGYSLSQFIAAELIMALGASCLSGAVDAWMKDSLLHVGDTDSHDLAFTKGELASRGSCLVGGALGYVWLLNDESGDIRPLWLVAGILIVIQIPLFAKLLQEHYFVPQKRSAKSSWQEMKRIGRDSISFGRQTPIVWNIIFFVMVVNTSLQSVNQQWSLVLDDWEGVNVLGPVWVGICIMSIAGGWLTIVGLNKGYNRKKMLNVSVIVTALSTLAMASGNSAGILIVYMMIQELPRGAFSPLTKSMLHDHIPSAQRATIGSFSNMVVSLGCAGGWFLSGIIVDQSSAQIAWAISTAALLLSLFLTPRLQPQR